jgi:hypothetical protein
MVLASPIGYGGRYRQPPPAFTLWGGWETYFRRGFRFVNQFHVEYQPRVPSIRFRSAFQVAMMICGGAAIGWAFRDLVSAALETFAAYRFPNVRPPSTPLARQFAYVGIQAAVGIWFFTLGYRARVLGLATSPLRIWVGVGLVWAMLLLSIA